MVQQKTNLLFLTPRFATHLDTISLVYHLKDFITFAYKTGWRISEIATLTWKQIDRSQGIVRLEVGETKNDDARTIYLDPELKQIFNDRWTHRSNLLPYVFLNKRGDDRIKRFDKAWKKACKEAKIGIRHFHDFRRTAVRNMVRSGIPERVAMTISGHKTRSVFDRYNIVNDRDLRLAAKQYDECRNQQDVNQGTVELPKYDLPNSRWWLLWQLVRSILLQANLGFRFGEAIVRGTERFVQFAKFQRVPR